MLSQKNRLKKQKDLKRVFKKGQGFKEDFLFLKLVKNNLKSTRFAFVVGLKVSKKATIRNHIKRRLREAVQARLSKTKTGLDVVLVAGPELADKDFWETEKTVQKLFKKAKLM